MLSSEDENLPDNVGAAYESELMQHMQLVIRKLGITRDHQPKKEVVEQTIRDLWKGAEPLSKIVVRYMATFIRRQEAQAGRNQTRFRNLS